MKALASQAKKNYEFLIRLKIDAAVREELDLIKNRTENFTIEKPQYKGYYENLNMMYDFLKDNPIDESSRAARKTAAKKPAAKKTPSKAEEGGFALGSDVVTYRVISHNKGREKIHEFTLNSLPNSGGNEYYQILHNGKAIMNVLQGGFVEAEKLLTTEANKYKQAPAKPAVKATKRPAPAKPAPRRSPSRPAGKAKAATKRQTSSQKANQRKRTQLREVNAEIRVIRAKNKANSKVFMRIAKQVEDQQIKTGLLGSKLDNDLAAAKEKLRLYKRFLASDKRKLRNIKRQAIGKVNLAGNKPPKKKEAQAEKPVKSFLDRLFAR